MIDHEMRFDAFLSFTDASDCWLWTGGKDRCGYGVFNSRGRRHKAHRWNYERLVGPIPVGLVLDHLCRVRNCVNPDHLEPVTVAENIARGEMIRAVCPQGHKKDESNLYRPQIKRGKGYRGRDCRTCRLEQAARFRQRARDEGLPPGDSRHGSEYGYCIFNCRCEDCRLARSLAVAQRKARPPHGAKLIVRNGEVVR